MNQLIFWTIVIRFLTPDFPGVSYRYVLFETQEDCERQFMDWQQDYEFMKGCEPIFSMEGRP